MSMMWSLAMSAVRRAFPNVPQLSTDDVASIIDSRSPSICEDEGARPVDSHPLSSRVGEVASDTKSRSPPARDREGEVANIIDLRSPSSREGEVADISDLRSPPKREREEDERSRAHDTVVVLDVRKKDEFEISHLARALNVDPDASADEVATLLRDHLRCDEMQVRNTRVICYCSIGWRSSRMCHRLIGTGFTDVSNLEGSIFRWANEDRPLVGDSAVHPYNRVFGMFLRPEKNARHRDSNSNS